MPEPGSVHALTPLTVQLDSSTTPQPGINMSSVTLVEGDRVDIEPVGSPTKQLHVLGSERQSVPTGVTAIWWTATAPAGWLILDGVDKVRATYPALFALWGTAFGAGDGSTTFGIPAPLGRSVVGQDPSQTEFATLGEVGGAKTHTLTTAEIPSHNHTQDAHNHTQNTHNHTQDAHNHTQDAHNHVASVEVGTAYQPVNVGTTFDVPSSLTTVTTSFTTATNQTATATNQTTVAVNQTATATNQVTGGGTAHSILNPSITAVFIVKT